MMNTRQPNCLRIVMRHGALGDVMTSSSPSEKHNLHPCSVSNDCVGKNLFGSNKPWPLQIKAGNYCLLHHYEIGGLLGLWQATSDGGKNLVPKMWAGKFPYQVKVKLVLPKVTEVPKKLLAELGVNPAVGRCDNCVDEDLAEDLIKDMLALGK